MLYRTIGAIAMAAALSAATAPAQAQVDAKYPDWKGQWVRIGAGGQYDPSKPPMRGQEPPLIPSTRPSGTRKSQKRAPAGSTTTPRSAASQPACRG